MTEPNGMMNRVIGGALVVVALAMIVYHLLAVWVVYFNALLHQNIHLAFAMVVLILVNMRNARSRLALLVNFLLLVLSIVAVIYVHVHYERLHMWAGFPETTDVYIGIILVLAVIYLTWQGWGVVFPILLAISIAYALFGHHIKGVLGHPHMNFDLVMSNLAIGFDGIYGMMLNASANLIFLFIIFGSVFESVGIGRFFIQVGNFLGRYIQGGAAQTAVFSSSLVGMTTGAAAANVALTGAYTIPLMKSAGFRPKYAGAIESVASTGGQLTPPIMGVAIFLMASFLGVSYAVLMKTALIPALVYYLAAFFGVILIAKRYNIHKQDLPIDRRMLIHGAPLFIVPMGIVTLLLILRYTPAYAAFFALFSLLFLAVLRKETRPPLGLLVKGLSSGAVMGASIAMACATIGMFTTMLTTTGAGPKLAGLIETLAGGNLSIALVLTMMLSIILGCAMPTPVAYAVAALVVAPVLVGMGMDLISAHFFVFYFAVLSAVTPPVAGASMVGSRLAGANYMATSFESVKIVGPFFLMPFFLARNPIVLSQPEPFWNALSCLVAIVVACSAFMFFLQKYYLTPVRGIERLLFLLTAILATAFGQYGGNSLFFISLVLFILLSVNQVVRSRKKKSQGTGLAARPNGS